MFMSYQVAYLMAASATLEAHRQHPEHVASLSLARKMLEHCRAALDAAAGLPGAPPVSEDATAVVLCMQVSRMPSALHDPAIFRGWFQNK